MAVPVNRLESIWSRAEAAETQPEVRSRPWSNKARSWERSLEELLADHPKLAIGAAAAIGIALGLIIKRK